MMIPGSNPNPFDRPDDEPDQAELKKWASWNRLRNPAAADRFLREHRGITLHRGSTKEEIDRAVRIYRASY
jgi:hypothetical protein